MLYLFLSGQIILVVMRATNELFFNMPSLFPIFVSFSLSLPLPAAELKSWHVVWWQIALHGLYQC